MISKITNKQKNDILCARYFIPQIYKDVFITPQDKQMFLENSERGWHKDKIGDMLNGFNALIQGKIWRGRHIEMYEEGVLDGSMPYYIILGGGK